MIPIKLRGERNCCDLYCAEGERDNIRERCGKVGGKDV